MPRQALRRAYSKYLRSDADDQHHCCLAASVFLGWDVTSRINVLDEILEVKLNRLGFRRVVSFQNCVAAKVAPVASQTIVLGGHFWCSRPPILVRSQKAFYFRARLASGSAARGESR